MTKLHNVRGRIYYISSPESQNLYAVYETTDRIFWTDLAKYSQEELIKAVRRGNVLRQGN